jgi:hypothetical protein
MKRLLLTISVTALILGAATVLQAKEITVRGNCKKLLKRRLVIVSGDTKYLILNPPRFSK